MIPGADRSWRDEDWRMELKEREAFLAEMGGLDDPEAHRRAYADVTRMFFAVHPEARKSRSDAA